ncbi:Protein phosphatase 1 regulatory subunit 14A [Chelonia mydas]|uniref:Protein phosphatase 1 regulatory subunit 14A n=1 Tax=Chelonia mydas TaxID=8469 RepID=M7BJZ3_CHEMY|nr:Protein phosphatase 1 regulatory subunit 14A [Chelonia mydas]
MAANRVGRGSLARSPGSPRAEPACSPEIQKRQARVTVKYDRQELQRRLDTEKWIDGRLEELYRGREAEMPEEVNIDELLELDADGARAAQLQGIPEVVSQQHAGLRAGAAPQAAGAPEAAGPAAAQPGAPGASVTPAQGGTPAALGSGSFLQTNGTSEAPQIQPGAGGCSAEPPDATAGAPAAGGGTGLAVHRAQPRPPHSHHSPLDSIPLLWPMTGPCVNL